jgi:hypothetical protein
LSKYSIEVPKCIVKWSEKVYECNGDTHCIEECTKELRNCLDIVFPPSTKTEFESDKINYILSTIFYLSNRLSKSVIGLAEFDKAMYDFEKAGKESQDSGEYKSIEENKKVELNRILAKYF